MAYKEIVTINTQKKLLITNTSLNFPRHDKEIIFDKNNSSQEVFNYLGLLGFSSTLLDKALDKIEKQTLTPWIMAFNHQIYYYHQNINRPLNTGRLQRHVNGPLYLTAELIHHRLLKKLPNNTLCSLTTGWQNNLSLITLSKNNLISTKNNTLGKRTLKTLNQLFIEIKTNNITKNYHLKKTINKVNRSLAANHVELAIITISIKLQNKANPPPRLDQKTTLTATDWLGTRLYRDQTSIYTHIFAN